MDPPTPLLADDHDDNGDDDQGHCQQPVQLVRVKAGAGDRHSDNLTLCRTTVITCITEHKISFLYILFGKCYQN